MIGIIRAFRAGPLALLAQEGIQGFMPVRRGTGYQVGSHDLHLFASVVTETKISLNCCPSALMGQCISSS